MRMYGFNVFCSLLCFVTLSLGIDLCVKEVHVRCPAPNDLFYDFPDNSDKLSTRCSEQQLYLECLADYQKKCGTDFLEIDSLHAALKTLSKICDKGSPLFNAVADNGKCFGKFYKTMMDGRLDKCLQKIQDENREKYEEVFYFSNDLKDEGREYCFLDIMETSCMADAINVDCGKTAKELFLHILNEIGFNNLICENRQEEAKNFMKELGLSLSPENSMEDFIALLENETEFN